MKVIFNWTLKFKKNLNENLNIKFQNLFRLIFRSMAPAKYASTAMSCMETSFGLGTMMGPFLGGKYKLRGWDHDGTISWR